MINQTSLRLKTHPLGQRMMVGLVYFVFPKDLVETVFFLFDELASCRNQVFAVSLAVFVVVFFLTQIMLMSLYVVIHRPSRSRIFQNALISAALGF